jgi:hypothetical protein
MDNMGIRILQQYRSIGALVALLLVDCVLPVFSLTTLTITPGGGFSIYPDIAVVDQSIATINIDSDTGYSVSLIDDNNGVLKNGANNLPYTVSYDGGGEITLSSTPSIVESVGTGVVDDGVRPLTIFVTAEQSVGIPAGDYSVTVTAEITAM